MAKRLLLIDANSLIHRAYHALPPLTTPRGEPSGAIYGFSSMLMKALRELKPDYAAACFDLPGPTFRHEAFEAYKAQRPKIPEELAMQLEKTKEILAAFGIPVITSTGFEADDVIGTLSHIAGREPELEIIILTGDLDTLQLATEKIKPYAMRRGISDMILYDRNAVKERYGFDPELIPDFKALKGDPSDNIPGVKGIGEKTAKELISKFGTLEKIYEAAEKSGEKDPMSKGVKEKLLAGREQAFLSRELARIRRDAPLATSLEDMKFYGTNSEKIKTIFENLGFKTLIERLKTDAAKRA